PGRHRRLAIPLRPGKAPGRTGGGADPMNRTSEPRDSLEAELEALRPLELPPALAARIGAQLDAPGRAARFRWWWIPAAVAAAASVGIAVGVWRAITHGVQNTPTVVHTTPDSPSGTVAREDIPALATYPRALSGPPEALNELLDRHAARSLSGGTHAPAGAGLLGRYDFNR